ncbi:MAG: aromatic-ring-hydroxylating dioxygenase subunit beta [Tistrella sp.]|mgnify:FL=1|uniref:Aromatic-ring-hydroxylating dioxygenase subunit beta n=2 Tax=Tistrella TaxID=171436 RepID=A0A3B9IU31_9PROT|nr:aromatic-ring-hydroxylating dioxygenase subunit beta [Tistrella sp.]MBA76737.1 aromatic-ring-hydroxylating dioxygenase subunit beta [Tistrella sp.]HAE51324.1 aromatic-ring-hydroxylating dioxygenase subunit beta [Tistrella mobilis]
MNRMITTAETDTALRGRVRDLYDAYYDTLDDVRLSDWPGFFLPDCLYRVIPRENFERGYTLSTMQAESRGMLQDRVTGLTTTQMYAPRYYRRFPGPLRISAGPEGIRTRHNLLIVQTLIDRQSEIVLSAVCHDRIVDEDGRLYFAERIVVIDSEMIPNSLIYPA